MASLHETRATTLMAGHGLLLWSTFQSMQLAGLVTGGGDWYFPSRSDEIMGIAPIDFFRLLLPLLGVVTAFISVCGPEEPGLGWRRGRTAFQAGSAFLFIVDIVPFFFLYLAHLLR